MSGNDTLIEMIVTDAEISTGRPPEWVLAHGAQIHRPMQAGKISVRSPRWTPEEDAYLRENLGYIPMDEIAQRIGRSTDAVRVHFIRRGFCSPRNLPGYISTREVAEILGVDTHAPPNWVDLGILPGEQIPYPGRINRRVRIGDFKRWLIHPTSWVYFKTGRIKNGSLRHLVELAQARWGDEWWTTRQAADYLGVTAKAVLAQIQRGRIKGFHAVGLDRRKTQAWALWFVRKSEIEHYRMPTYSDSRKFTPAADTFMLKARLEWELPPSVIARMMKRTERQIDFRIRLLCLKNGINRTKLTGKKGS